MTVHTCCINIYIYIYIYFQTSLLSTEMNLCVNTSASQELMSNNVHHYSNKWIKSYMCLKLITSFDITTEALILCISSSAWFCCESFAWIAQQGMVLDFVYWFANFRLWKTMLACAYKPQFAPPFVYGIFMIFDTFKAL